MHEAGIHITKAVRQEKHNNLLTTHEGLPESQNKMSPVTPLGKGEGISTKTSHTVKEYQRRKKLSPWSQMLRITKDFINSSNYITPALQYCLLRDSLL